MPPPSVYRKRACFFCFVLFLSGFLAVGGLDDLPFPDLVGLILLRFSSILIFQGKFGDVRR